MFYIVLMLLLPETAAVPKTSFASGGRAENGATTLARDHGLSVAENGGDLQTSCNLKKMSTVSRAQLETEMKTYRDT